MTYANSFKEMLTIREMLENQSPIVIDIPRGL